jgi:hypothetical protein
MLTRRMRLRRAAILCCHALTNIAYYRSGRVAGVPRLDGTVHITIANNFLDIAVIEWCKLFGDKADTPTGRKQQHSWRIIVGDAVAFEAGLLHQLACSAAEFEALRAYARSYRDKFLAHLDDLETMKPPMLDLIKASAAYYYDHLIAHENDGATFQDACGSAVDFYNARAAEGRAYYERLVAVS